MKVKVILYMAITANGYIAREDGGTPWSAAEFKAYYNFVKERGNVVVGRKTYELMKKGEDFKKCGNPVAVVVSRNKGNHDDSHDSRHVFVSSPREALKILKEKKFKEAVVGGGAMLNAAFLKEKLIDEIILDVESFMFGKGMKLFGDTDAEMKLELLEVSRLSANTVRLRYNVKK